MGVCASVTNGVRPGTGSIDRAEAVFQVSDSEAEDQRVMGPRAAQLRLAVPARREPAVVGSIHGGGDVLRGMVARTRPASSANVEDLQREMVLIREALNKLQCEETFIVQGRTRRHHVIAIPERDQSSIAMVYAVRMEVRAWQVVQN